MMSSQVDAFKAGAAAFKQRHFSEAAKYLETYCHAHVGVKSKAHFQAQIWLVQSYKAIGKKPEARHLCWILSQADEPQVKAWATEMMHQLPVEIPGQPPPQSRNKPTRPGASPAPLAPAHNPIQNPALARPSPASQDLHPSSKGDRVSAGDISLAQQDGAGRNLAVITAVTWLGAGMLIMALIWSLFWAVQGRFDASQPLEGLPLAVGGAIAANLVGIGLAPALMDRVQRQQYGTRWTQLSEVKRHSPEAARLIEQICATQQLKQPRLGIIDDPHPIALAYGSLLQPARLVVSQGLFRYLEPEEIAAVYAQLLGQSLQGSLTPMTLALALLQLPCGVAFGAENTKRRLGSDLMSQGLSGLLQAAIATALGLYGLGEAGLLFLSRTRQYEADRFATEVTGNPNGLALALAKLSYGIVEADARSPQPSPALLGLRSLNILDSRSARTVGTAYPMAMENRSLGTLFVWDLFNPWANWIELGSSHPLPGKRFRALAGYAGQLDLADSFDLARVNRVGQQLDKKRLYRSFGTDLLLLFSPLLGLVVGLSLGFALGFFLGSGGGNVIPAMSGALLGLGLGHWVHGLLLFPSLKNRAQTNSLRLMADAYSSPLRGQPVQLAGSLLGPDHQACLETGRGNVRFRFKDDTGLVCLRYSSRWGAFGNAALGWHQANQYLAQPAWVTGWFRRGLVPQVDMSLLESSNRGSAKGYHRWSKFAGAGLCLVGAGLLGWLG